MALREIFAHFGFDFDKAGLDRVNKAVDGVKHHAKEAGGEKGIGGLAEGIKAAFGALLASEAVRFVNEAAEQAAALKDVSDQTGLATDELQAYSLAAELAGGSQQDFVTGLKKLSKELATGTDEMGQPSKLFAKLHIATKDAKGEVRSFADVLPDIADKISSLKSPAEQTALAVQIFGRGGQHLLPILKQGAAGVEQLKDNLDDLGGGFSQDAIDQADAYDDALVRLRYAWKSIQSLLLVHVVPVFEDIAVLLGKATAQFGAMANNTTTLTTAVGVLAVMLSTTLLEALAPFILPGLAFLGIFLAVDDLIAFLKGQDSVIGAVLNGWFGEDFTNDVRDTFNSIYEIAKGTLSGIYDLWKALTSDSGAETDKWLDKFMADTAGMSAAFDNFGNYVTTIGLRIQQDFYEMVAGLQTAWNNFVGSLHLPENVAGKLKVSPESIVDTTNHLVAASVAAANVRNNIENNKDKIAGVQTPTSLATAPVAAPVVHTNYVELNAPVSVTLPPGVTPVQARALARDAQKGGADAYRSAVQSLEQRAGG